MSILEALHENSEIMRLTAERDAARAEVERLKAALKRIAELEGDSMHQKFDLTRWQCAQVARKALAALSALQPKAGQI